jgi:hypothetical protein
MSPEATADEGAGPCRPPFPIFPIVFPLMLPIGFMLLMGRRRRRRQRSLEKRMARLEDRLAGLEETVASE